MRLRQANPSGRRQGFNPPRQLHGYLRNDPANPTDRCIVVEHPLLRIREAVRVEWHRQGMSIIQPLPVEGRVHDRRVLWSEVVHFVAAARHERVVRIVRIGRRSQTTEEEIHKLPHVILTDGVKWKPSSLDYSMTDNPDWYNLIAEEADDEYPRQSKFDMYGNLKEGYQIENEIARKRKTSIPAEPGSDPVYVITAVSAPVYKAHHEIMEMNQVRIMNEESQISGGAPVVSKEQPLNIKKYQPNFLHVPDEKICRTFEATTQGAITINFGTKLQQMMKSPYPAMNVPRRFEPVATDTIFSKTPAVATGMTAAQIFVGRKSCVIDVIGLKSKENFPSALEDIIRKRGAMNLLISDGSKEQTSQRVKDILRSLQIKDWQSEASYQHQNFAERVWKHLKGNVNFMMNLRNVPANAWLLCAQWCADVMNHTAQESLGWKPPLQVLTGQTVDISILLQFCFWDVVYITCLKSKSHNNQIGTES